MTSKSTMATRNTRQKNAIRAAFIETGRPLSPDEVLDYAQQKVRDIGAATVYRNLKVLVEEGWLVAVPFPGEPQRYEVSGKGHHHHFWCNSCKRAYELEGCTPELKLKLPPGFRTLGHEVVLYGMCAACSPGRA